MLEIKNLYKQYGSFVALNHINLSVEEGQIFGFVGPNGAGKTTTMRILATLMRPTSGEAYIDGISVMDNPKMIRSIIGYMPDFFGVYDDLKVIEYLEFYGGITGLSHTECLKVSGELMELVRLSEKKDVYVDKLSRGMKQRLCLARSLMGNPKLLILDEPASGMDPRARIEMKQILKDLKDMQKTILISSHILPELAELCDTFGIIEHGEFKFIGNMDEMARKMHGGQLLRIRSNGRLEEIVVFLKQFPGIGAIEFDTDIRTRFDGKEELIERLLRELVQQGFPIIGFSMEDENLEHVFLEVTKSNED